MALPKSVLIREVGRGTDCKMNQSGWTQARSERG